MEREGGGGGVVVGVVVVVDGGGGKGGIAVSHTVPSSIFCQPFPLDLSTVPTPSFSFITFELSLTHGTWGVGTRTVFLGT